MAKKTLTFGAHAAQALIEEDPARVLEVWLQKDRPAPAIRRALEASVATGIAVKEASRETLDRLSGSKVHQGVVVRHLEGIDSESVLALPALLRRRPPPDLLMVLDQVQDPRNLGACLRCAAGAGVDALIIPKRRSALLTPTARKAASGAAERVPLVTATNLARALDEIDDAGITLVGTAADAPDSLFDLDLRPPVAFVLGGEEKGLRRLTREKCHRIVSIPLRPSIESLNVSVVAGICLFEAVRQRRKAI